MTEHNVIGITVMVCATAATTITVTLMVTISVHVLTWFVHIMVDYVRRLMPRKVSADSTSSYS